MKNTDIARRLPEPLYTTHRGAAYCADALELLRLLPDDAIDLVLTSPPFALQRKKSYGNEEQDMYVDWLTDFAKEILRVLKSSGSFVLDLGGAYEKKRPVRSLYNYRVLIRFCDELGFRLAEEFFWYNPAKLPSPIEWVNKRKIRVKDAVNTVWWFSKTDHPKANVNHVLAPYSERMKLLLKNGEKFYSPKERPSGHDISKAFNSNNGGSIPPNLLQIPNTESNSQYLRFCKLVNAPGHPARFPEKLPEFFIKFLTERDDVVLDIFAGSNTTGAVAERLHRNWLAFEKDRDYLAASIFRFVEDNPNEARATYSRLRNNGTKTFRVPQEALLFR